ncbi:hypothetical protein [Phenylobacterium sp.]|uniref:hypothetical protein n=1 Tax=Phenylobacterium sp. TaxID=1871053 RepID=UPI002C452C66|nr:hypothetical protein [Phenylobacterium sp.]HLZ76949.1 hypothetical protein [Phenylobacterium sp.]
MFKRLLILAAPLLALAGPGHAADDKKPKEVGQYVDLQPVGLPIVVDGRLVNYVFVYVRVNLRPSADVTKVRDKEPAFRDALVRDGHKTPFVVATDWQKLDEAKLIAAMTRDASAIAGPGIVASVVVTSQTPQKHVMPPRPAPPETP